MTPEAKSCCSHTATEIKGFFGPYRWLSNFHACTVAFEGALFPSSEAAYQAAKFDRSLWGRFQHITPREAKVLGLQMGAPLDGFEGWEARKVDVMRAVLTSKFTRNPPLRYLLVETGERYLEETNYWDDSFWGVCHGKGENMLGKLLMEIRTKLKSET